MTLIYGFLIVVEALISALLIGVIFLQKSKGGMGGSAFGGGGVGEAIFGSRMGNVLTKATVVLAVIFLTNTVLLTMLTARRDSVGGSVTDGVVPATVPASDPLGGMSLPVPADMPVSAPVEAAPVAAPVTVDVPAPVAVDIPVPELAPTAPAAE
jgi:preprotein translocase subunit SecG